MKHIHEELSCTLKSQFKVRNNSCSNKSLPSPHECSIHRLPWADRVPADQLPLLEGRGEEGTNGEDQDWEGEAEQEEGCGEGLEQTKPTHWSGSGEGGRRELKQSGGKVRLRCCWMHRKPPGLFDGHWLDTQLI